MKKKIFVVMLVLSFALSCFALTACGDKNKAPSVPGPDASSVKGEQVTAEQWAAAFDLSNVTNVSFKETLEQKKGNVTGGYVWVVQYDGNKAYDYAEEYSGKEKDWQFFYYEKEGETAYVYDVVDGKWARDPNGHVDIDWEVQNELYDALREYGAVNVAQEFALFTYDAKQKAYVRVVPDDGGSPVTMLVKIADGKLRVAQVSFTREDNEAITASFQLFDYGTTKVNLPTVGSKGTNSNESSGSGSSSDGVLPGEKEDNKMDEAMWRDALNANGAFRNCTVTVLSGNETMVVANLDLGEGALAIHMAGEGDVIYSPEAVYVNVGSGWSYMSIPDPEKEYNEQVESTLAAITLFCNYYNEFTYDEHEDVYIAASVTVTDPVTSEPMTCTNVTQRFVQYGPHRYLLAEVAYTKEEETVTIRISQYDNTEVGIPELPPQEVA